MTAPSGHAQRVLHLEAAARTDDEEAQTIRKFEYERARQCAATRGMGFLVHGVYVSPEHVEIVSAPEGTGPIAEMRRAKQEALDALAELRRERALNSPF